MSFQKYVCDKSGKQFTEKSNLNRHMKTHVDSSQTHSCDVCEKEHKWEDHRKRHQQSHDYTITCPVCGQYFNRRENMLRHRALHQRHEVRPMMKRPASLGHPIVLQGDHEFTVPSLLTVRPSVNHLSKMNPKSSQKTRRPVSYI